MMRGGRPTPHPFTGNLGLDLGDPFGVQAAFAELSRALHDRAAESVAAAHVSAVNRLDAFTTMLQKVQGDPADMLQRCGGKPAS